jgi:hypothetical protein
LGIAGGRAICPQISRDKVGHIARVVVVGLMVRFWRHRWSQKEAHCIKNKPSHDCEAENGTKLSGQKADCLSNIIATPQSDREVRTGQAKNNHKPKQVHPSRNLMLGHQISKKGAL